MGYSLLIQDMISKSTSLAWFTDQIKLNREQLGQEYRQAFVNSGKGKKGSRYYWNFFHVINVLRLAKDKKYAEVSDDLYDFWEEHFKMSVEDLLMATGAMKYEKIDLGTPQGQRKSTGIMQLIYMFYKNVHTVPENFELEFEGLMKEHSDQHMSLGLLLIFMSQLKPDVMYIRTFDKDQVGGVREISALDFLGVVSASYSEACWATVSKSHHIDAIMSPSKHSELDNLCDSIKRERLRIEEKLTKQSGTKNMRHTLIVSCNRDMSRFGPNQEIAILILMTILLFDVNTIKQAFMMMGPLRLYVKIYKPPEALCELYLKVKAKGLSPKGDGYLSQALHYIDGLKENEFGRGLRMRGGMGQGILGIQASCMSSFTLDYIEMKVLGVLGHKGIYSIKSKVTSDDSITIYILKKKDVYNLVPLIESLERRLFSMSNLLVNDKKTVYQLSQVELNSIFQIMVDDGTRFVGTTPFVKYTTSMMHIPEELSFADDVMRSHDKALNTMMVGVPMELALVTLINSLDRCMLLHHKWPLFFKNPDVRMWPITFGGLPMISLMETTVTPYASYLLSLNKVMDLNDPKVLSMIAHGIIAGSLNDALDDESLKMTDELFKDIPVLYKKGVNSIRYSRRPSKRSRKNIRELPQVLNLIDLKCADLIHPKTSVDLGTIMSSFGFRMYKNTTEDEVAQPANKWPMAVGMLTRSFTSKCLIVPKASLFKQLFPEEGKISLQMFEEKIMALDTSTISGIMYNHYHELSQVELSPVYMNLKNHLAAQFKLIVHIRNFRLHRLPKIDLAQGMPTCCSPEKKRIKLVKIVPYKDAMELEKDLKEYLFLSFGGQQAVEVLRSQTSLPYNDIGEGKMPVVKAMQMADLLGDEIISSTCIKDRTMLIRGEGRILGYQTLVTQLIKYNTFYNYEIRIPDNAVPNLLPLTISEIFNMSLSVDTERVVGSTINQMLCNEMLLEENRDPIKLYRVVGDVLDNVKSIKLRTCFSVLVHQSRNIDARKTPDKKLDLMAGCARVTNSKLSLDKIQYYRMLSKLAGQGWIGNEELGFKVEPAGIMQKVMHDNYHVMHVIVKQRIMQSTLWKQLYFCFPYTSPKNMFVGGFGTSVHVKNILENKLSFPENSTSKLSINDPDPHYLLSYPDLRSEPVRSSGNCLYLLLDSRTEIPLSRLKLSPMYPSLLPSLDEYEAPNITDVEITDERLRNLDSLDIYYVVGMCFAFNRDYVIPSSYSHVHFSEILNLSKSYVSRQGLNNFPLRSYPASNADPNTDFEFLTFVVERVVKNLANELSNPNEIIGSLVTTFKLNLVFPLFVLIKDRLALDQIIYMGALNARFEQTLYSYESWAQQGFKLKATEPVVVTDDGIGGGSLDPILKEEMAKLIREHSEDRVPDSESDYENYLDEDMEEPTEDELKMLEAVKKELISWADLEDV